MVLRLTNIERYPYMLDFRLNVIFKYSVSEKLQLQAIEELENTGLFDLRSLRILLGMTHGMTFRVTPGLIDEWTKCCDPYSVMNNLSERIASLNLGWIIHSYNVSMICEGFHYANGIFYKELNYNDPIQPKPYTCVYSVRGLFFSSDTDNDYFNPYFQQLVSFKFR